MKYNDFENIGTHNDGSFSYSYEVPAGTEAAIDEVLAEFSRASNMYPDVSNSAHEAFAVLKEEVDELWEEVRGKTGQRDAGRLRKEACQVAAMAVRFMVDVANREGKV